MLKKTAAARRWLIAPWRTRLHRSFLKAAGRGVPSWRARRRSVRALLAGAVYQEYPDAAPRKSRSCCHGWIVAISENGAVGADLRIGGQMGPAPGEVQDAALAGENLTATP